MPTNIVIANTSIDQDESGRFCLNDLHRASGGERRHGPALWMENQQTKELVDALAQELSDTGFPVSVVKGGITQGTYVCKELVYAYAMWISAKFHLQVIRAYDSLVAAPPAPAALSTMDILQIAMESEKGRLLAIEQRDHAIQTKAQIGSKREATAMATAATAKREAAKLKDQLGFSARHATILQVEDAAGGDFNFVDLRRWCKANEVTPETVPDKRYPNGVKAWPAGAWMAVYGVDLAVLFGEGLA